MSAMKQCLFVVIYCLFMDSNDKCIIKVFTIFGAISSVLELRTIQLYQSVTILDIISDLSCQNNTKWFIEPNISSRINPKFYKHGKSFELDKCRNMRLIEATSWTAIKCISRQKNFKRKSRWQVTLSQCAVRHKSRLRRVVVWQSSYGQMIF